MLSGAVMGVLQFALCIKNDEKETSLSKKLHEPPARF